MRHKAKRIREFLGLLTPEIIARDTESLHRIADIILKGEEEDEQAKQEAKA